MTRRRDWAELRALSTRGWRRWVWRAVAWWWR